MHFGKLGTAFWQVGIWEFLHFGKPGGAVMRQHSPTSAPLHQPLAFIIISLLFSWMVNMFDSGTVFAAGMVLEV
jgi:hypothetical protein